jgi:hypothetical protein
MEKQKYEKPIVLDLNGNSANGGPLSCVSGESAIGEFQTCNVGVGAAQSCQFGGHGGPYQACTPGNEFGGSGGCASGTLPGGYCEGGSGGFNYYGCNVGPSG